MSDPEQLPLFDLPDLTPAPDPRAIEWVKGVLRDTGRPDNKADQYDPDLFHEGTRPKEMIVCIAVGADCPGMALPVSCCERQGCRGAKERLNAQ